MATAKTVWELTKIVAKRKATHEALLKEARRQRARWKGQVEEAYWKGRVEALEDISEFIE